MQSEKKIAVEWAMYDHTGDRSWVFGEITVGELAILMASNIITFQGTRWTVSALQDVMWDSNGVTRATIPLYPASI